MKTLISGRSSTPTQPQPLQGQQNPAQGSPLAPAGSTGTISQGTPSNSPPRPPAREKARRAQAKAAQQGHLRSPTVEAQDPTPGSPSTSTGAHLPDLAMRKMPSSIDELQTFLDESRGRPVDLEAAAAVVNTVRRYGLRAGDDQASLGRDANASLIARISEQAVTQWNTAQGMSAADYEQLQRGAVISGSLNPLGTDPMTMLIYGVAPFLASANQKVALGFAVAMALLAPAVNARLQSGVVTHCDFLRDRNGPTVALDKEAVNARLSLPDAASHLTERTEEFGRRINDFQVALDHEPDTRNPSAQLRQLADAVIAASREVCDAQKEVLSTQGARSFNQVSNVNQVYARTVRPVVGALLAMGTTSQDSGGGPEVVADGRHAGYSQYGSAGLQLAGVTLAVLGHHWAAATDEKNKQVYRNKLNMLYADVFTEAGQARFKAGDDTVSDDIDPTKLRKLINSPAQAFAARVAEAVRDKAGRVCAELSQLHPGWDDDVPAPRPATLTPAQNSKLNALQEEHTQLSQDQTHLETGKVTAVSAEGYARELIDTGLQQMRGSKLLKAAIHKKYANPVEFSAQAIQRYGQNWQMLVAGGGLSSFLGRSVTVTQGWASNMSTGLLAGMAAAVGALQGYGALTHHAAISEKDHRRDSPGTVSWEGQLARTLVAGPREAFTRIGSSNRVEESRVRLREAQGIVNDARAVLLTQELFEVSRNEITACFSLQSHST